MFNLTDRVRKAMQLAEGHRHVASCDHISTEHVLLGLIGAGGVACDALRRLGVTEESVKAKVAEAMAEFESTFTKLITGPTNEQTH